MENKPTELEAITSDAPVECEYPTKETGRKLTIAPTLIGNGAITLHDISRIRRWHAAEAEAVRSRRPLEIEKAPERLEICSTQDQYSCARPLGFSSHYFDNEANRVMKVISKNFISLSVKDMLKKEFFAGLALSQNEQTRNRTEIDGSIDKVVKKLEELVEQDNDNLRVEQFNQMVERARIGKASPGERMQLFIEFSKHGLSSMELAKSSHYGEGDGCYQFNSNQLVEQAIVNVGGELFENSSFRCPKPRAFDLTPALKGKRKLKKERQQQPTERNGRLSAEQQQQRQQQLEKSISRIEFISTKEDNNITPEEGLNEALALGGIIVTAKRDIGELPIEEVGACIVKERVKWFMDFKKMEEEFPNEYKRLEEKIFNIPIQAIRSKLKEKGTTLTEVLLLCLREDKEVEEIFTKLCSHARQLSEQKKTFAVVELTSTTYIYNPDASKNQISNF